MELCIHCRRPVLKRDRVYVSVQHAKATHSSPAEYSEEPMHQACVTSAHEEALRDMELKALRGASDERRERF